MSYQLAREHLEKYRKSAALQDGDVEILLDALTQLTDALATDLTQIKVAIAQLASLIEQQSD